MPNKPSIENVQRSIRVERELDAKVLKRFRIDERMTVKEAYILALQFATVKVELTSDDYRRIFFEKQLMEGKVY